MTLTSPLQLFQNGVNGVWFDNSNMSTLYQDAAGTTPVTALEQPVGLQLDLSQGLVLGSELVTNGSNLVSTTGWTSVNSSLSAVGGNLQVVASSSTNPGATQTISTVAGSWYKISCTAIAANGNAVANAARLGVGGIGVIGAVTSNGVTQTISGYFLAAASSYAVSVQVGNTGAYGNAGDTATFGSITVKKLAGNHRYQPTSANRPTWSARYNQLTKSENLAVSPWLTANTGAAAPTLAANAGTDPLGGSTATRIIYPTSTGAQVSKVYQQPTSPASGTGTAYKNSIQLRGAVGGEVVYLLGATTGGYATVTCTLTTAWQTFTLPAVSVAGGWNIQLGQETGAGNAGMAACTIYAWGADLRPSDQATGLIPTYQAVNTSTDYTTTGFPPYLAYNGTSSFMQTAAIDFTGTAQMTVWNGNRVLNGNDNYLMELSANCGVNNGSFNIESFANDFYLPVRGSLFSRLYAVGATTPPQSMVLSIAYDLAVATAATQIKPRKNGATLSTTVFNETTAGGYFGNYAMYFGVHNSTTYAAYNEYQTIIRGAASDTAAITFGETFTNSKTKAY